MKRPLPGGVTVEDVFPGGYAGLLSPTDDHRDMVEFAQDAYKKFPPAEVSVRGRRRRDVRRETALALALIRRGFETRPHAASRWVAEAVVPPGQAAALAKVIVREVKRAQKIMAEIAAEQKRLEEERARHRLEKPVVIIWPPVDKIR